MFCWSNILLYCYTAHKYPLFYPEKVIFRPTVHVFGWNANKNECAPISGHLNTALRCRSTSQIDQFDKDREMWRLKRGSIFAWYIFDASPTAPVSRNKIIPPFSPISVITSSWEERGRRAVETSTAAHHICASEACTSLASNQYLISRPGRPCFLQNHWVHQCGCVVTSPPLPLGLVQVYVFSYF